VSELLSGSVRTKRTTPSDHTRIAYLLAALLRTSILSKSSVTPKGKNSCSTKSLTPSVPLTRHTIYTPHAAPVQILGSFSTDSPDLNPFLLVTFADLKKYVYHYWFAFPALVAKPGWEISEDGAQAAEEDVRHSKEDEDCLAD
jgi:hypothetical protein